MNASVGLQDARVSVFIPNPWHTLNLAMKMHWGAKARLRMQWEIWLRYAFTLELDRLGLPPLRDWPVEPRSAILTRYSRGTCDYDGLVGGAKQLVDALVACNALAGDSPDLCAIEYRQVAGRRKGTSVEIVTGLIEPRLPFRG
jgi:hypothetical protein